MVQIFYKTDGKIISTPKCGDLDTLSIEDVVWIDLFAPTEEEKHDVEIFLGTTIQSRAMELLRSESA